MEKKSNHQVNVVRITEILPHTNADSLELIHIGGYQVVVKKDQFKVGDLAVYVQPDSVVPQTEPFKFIWEPYQTDPAGVVPEKRRRITVRKFRKEWSEGLLLPITDFHDPYNVKLNILDFKEGEDVSDFLDITHYDPDREREATTGESISGPRLKYPKTLKGWFYFGLRLLGWKRFGTPLTQEVKFQVPTYDVEALKNYKNAFLPGEQVIVTEKIHGSNARYVFFDGEMYAGSRNLWKSPKSNCIWRKALKCNPWIEEWCRAHEGHTLYGEVTPTQEGFDYGVASGDVDFFLFDIRSPLGDWLDKSLTLQTGAPVPVLYAGPFDLDVIQKFVDGPSTVAGAKHVREGVVITPVKERHVTGLGRLQLKLVSNVFLDKDKK